MSNIYNTIGKTTNRKSIYSDLTRLWSRSTSSSLVFYLNVAFSFSFHHAIGFRLPRLYFLFEFNGEFSFRSKSANTDWVVRGQFPRITCSGESLLPYSRSSSTL